jgi:CBS domain-containing protein
MKKQNETLRSIMTTDTKTVSTADSVADAARTMQQAGIGGVMVSDASGKLCGFLTDRDVVVRVVAEHRDPEETEVGDVCTRDVLSLSPDDPVDRAIEAMAEHKIRRIPVVENGKPVGLVSLGDLAQVRDPGSVLGTISAAPPNA